MIPRALKYIRQFHDVPAAQLANQLGYSKSYISEIESGNKRINMDVIEKYSEFFDIPISSIFILSEGLEGHKGDSVSQQVAKRLVRKILVWIANE